MATDEPACHVLSILVRQQQGGYGPVRFGDDPQRFTRVRVVATHQTKPVDDVVLVLGDILWVECPPIPVA